MILSWSMLVPILQAQLPGEGDGLRGHPLTCLASVNSGPRSLPLGLHHQIQIGAVFGLRVNLKDSLFPNHGGNYE